MSDQGADVEGFEVVVSAGDLRPATGGTVMPHRWTDAGVTIESEFTGAHLYLLAAAGCVLNDLYREAAGLGIALDGARVRAAGSFDPTTWCSTGVTYEIQVTSSSTSADLDRLVRIVDDVAEIPKALRAGTTVTRIA